MSVARWSDLYSNFMLEAVFSTEIWMDLTITVFLILQEEINK